MCELLGERDFYGKVYTPPRCHNPQKRLISELSRGTQLDPEILY